MRSSPQFLRVIRASAGALCVFLGSAACAASSGRLGGSVAFTTDYLLRGVSQSQGAGALQAQLHYQTPGGWLAGVWASSTSLNPGDGRTAEINAFASHSWRVGDDWSTKLAVAHYAYPWNSPGGFYDYDELSAGLAFRDLAFLTIAVSPNTPLEAFANHDHTAVSLDLALRRPLIADWSAVGGIGHYDLSGTSGGGYWYWNAGLGYDSWPWHLDLSWFGTSSVEAGTVDPDLPLGFWAATLMWRF